MVAERLAPSETDIENWRSAGQAAVPVGCHSLNSMRRASHAPLALTSAVLAGSRPGPIRDLIKETRRDPGLSDGTACGWQNLAVALRFRQDAGARSETATRPRSEACASFRAVPRPGCAAPLHGLPGLRVCCAEHCGEPWIMAQEGVRGVSLSSGARGACGTIRSTIPARVDRRNWTPFHSRMVAALAVAWILDGLEITIASSIAGALTSKSTLGLSSTAVGAIATVYLAGEVVGALGFGKLSDQLGRRKLFVVTLGVYLIGSGLTALTAGNTTGWIVYMYLTRFIAGTGIGGEYAAINSAIDELIPARDRGRGDITVNGTYWAGAIIRPVLPVQRDLLHLHLGAHEVLPRQGVERSVVPGHFRGR